MLWSSFVALLSILPVYALKTKYIGFTNATQPTKFKPEEKLGTGDQFGHAVAIWDDLSLISSTRRVAKGGIGSVVDEGVVYVFMQGNDGQWYEKSYIESPSATDGFGESLSLWKKTAAIGAWKDESNGAYAGKAYVYYSSENKLLDKYQALYPDRPAAGDFFGYSVAIVPGNYYYPDGTVVVGAYGHNADGHWTDTGAVFVFAYYEGSWTQVTMITPSELVGSEKFGYSVAGHVDAVVVGAPGAESAYVYHLEGVTTECPPANAPEQNIPEECRDRRRLQGGAPPADNKRFYTEWRYVEVLHVRNDPTYGDAEGFGTSVGVYNESALSIAIGTPYDNDRGNYAGAVYVLTKMNKGDIWSSWSPGGDDHHEGDGHHEGGHRRLQEPRNEDHMHNVWEIREAQFTTDKDGAYWMKEGKIYGTQTRERFGYVVAIHDDHFVVGTATSTSARGQAYIYARNTTDNVDSNIPIYKGYLYRKAWRLMSSLNDVLGGIGDNFGSAVAVYETTVIVGADMTGFQTNYDVGTGGAYVYDAFVYPYQMKLESDGSSSSLATSPAFVSFYVVFFVVVVGVLITLVVRNTKTDAVSAEPGFWETLTGYFSSKKESLPEYSMDSSTNSMPVDSSHPLQPPRQPRQIKARVTRQPLASQSAAQRYGNPGRVEMPASTGQSNYYDQYVTGSNMPRQPQYGGQMP